jgi:16S rRNA (adenine1518-N6/adenine1519-N6)-dimethyltransferase
VGELTLGAAEIRELLDRHQLDPSRSLGQNFVVDPNTVERIVRVAGVESGDRVIEIGPGLGSLTVGLAAAADEVVAIELDRHLLPPLSEVLERRGLAGRVEVVNADATEIDWGEFGRKYSGAWRLVANLPYNVAAPVVLRVLDEAPFVSEILVMVQREVGERLAAPAGASDRGIPSVKAQYWADVSLAGTVPASVFHPVPKVESVLVRLSRRSAVADVDLVVLWKLVNAGFGQRRKMLRRSLAGLVEAQVFEAAQIEPTARPQDLTVAEWVGLARAAGG